LCVKVGNALRPVDIGRAVGLSAQSVRKYERWGFLPPAERGENGYRLYGPRHLQAMRSVVVMCHAFGWRTTARIMRAVHAGDLPRALTALDAQYAQLHLERTRLEQTLGALRITTALSRAPRPAATARKGPPGRRTLLFVGEAAERARVEVSALRHWEREGLVDPGRDDGNGYRLYDDEQLLRVQVIALLRQAGYELSAIRPVVEALSAGRPELAVEAAERRLRALAEGSRRHVAATAAFQVYLEEIGL
jgi:DNA-binding transcriptional MerR regulator